MSSPTRAEREARRITEIKDQSIKALIQRISEANKKIKDLERSSKDSSKKVAKRELVEEKIRYNYKGEEYVDNPVTISNFILPIGVCTVVEWAIIGTFLGKFSPIIIPAVGYFSFKLERYFTKSIITTEESKSSSSK